MFVEVVAKAAQVTCNMPIFAVRFVASAGHQGNMQHLCSVAAGAWAIALGAPLRHAGSAVLVAVVLAVVVFGS